MDNKQDAAYLRKLADQFEANFAQSKDPARSISGLLRRAAEKLDSKADQSVRP